MKLHRSGLVAGLLALGVAACADDVTVVEPTPPPPPVVASMSPGAAVVAVGNSADFAVNVSGGSVGAAVSIACASSNTTIAEVVLNGSICRATGLAVGGVTITANVEKGGETTSVGA